MVCLCAVSFVLTLSDPNPIQVPEIWIPISVVFGSYALLCSILAAYKLRLFIKQAGLEPSLPQIALFMEIFCGIGGLLWKRTLTFSRIAAGNLAFYEIFSDPLKS